MIKLSTNPITMRTLFLVLLSFLLIDNVAYSSVSYSHEELVDVPQKYKLKKRKLERIDQGKPNKINSPRIGKVYMIIGIVVASVALMIALLLLVLMNPLVWVVFLIPVLFFITGISMIISGAILKGRNKDWDIDYR